jgi:hypothetical protein
MKTIALASLITFLAVGCGAGAVDDKTNNSKNAISVFPSAVFTGFETGGAQFTAVAVADSNQDPSEVIKWVPSNQNIAVVTSAPSALVKIQAHDGGSTTVSGSATDREPGTVSVTVTAYPAGSVARGQTVYGSFGCAGCHEAGAGSPDITTSGIGKHSDEQVLGAAIDGNNPEGGSIGSFHKFAVPDASKPDLLSYLRSLPPRGIPAPDQ